MKLKLLFFLLFFASIVTNAQTSLYEKHWFIQEGDTLPYRLLLPQNYDSSKSYPLILFLHGAGERGDDNEAQLKHGSGLFLQDSIRTKYPAIVVFPQCPESSFWSNVKIKTDTLTKARIFTFNKGGKPTTAMKMLMDLINYLDGKYKINEGRHYVMGLSMGGMGTLELVRRKPDYFAAAIAICGGAHTATAKKLAKTKWWIFHGAKDDVVPVRFSEEIATALQKKHADVKLTIYPGAKHNSWDDAFAEKNLLHWLFEQKNEPQRH